jgi:hypothetical protein
MKCGAIKHGAFNSCAACGARLLSEDDLACSLALSDHYFSADVLEEVSASMLAGNPRPSLPPELEKKTGK